MSRRKSLLCLAVWCSALACGNTGAPAQDYGPMLKDLTEKVILPEHQDFVAQAQALVVAAKALSDSPDADKLKSAQSAWRDARKAYRVLDALHFGPDYTSLVSDRIDVSPVDPAGIEAIVSSGAAVDDHAVGLAGGKKKGFLGLQYLLFPDPSTPDAAAPVLAHDAPAARRRSFALSMADEIAESAVELDNGWEPSGDNFAQQLELAGAGSTQYPTQRAAVDDLVSGGVAYALEQLVGVRLALPLGLRSGGTPDPSVDPTLPSDNAVADMQSTLSGVLALYEGRGFSSAVSAQSAALDQTVLSEISKLQKSLGSIPAPFADAVVNHTASVEAAYEDGKALKATWNTDVSSALGATAKPADTDGD